MNCTPYSTENQAMSDAAHLVAQESIYPSLFGCNRSSLSFECVSISTGERGRVLDGQMGIDRVVSVRSKYFQHPLKHTVQERFRKMQYQDSDDLTITEWNNRTEQPSELYKINAGVFVYGYFDQQANDIPRWIAVDTTRMLLFITAGKIMYGQHENYRSGQDFIAIGFRELRKSGCVIAEHRDGLTWSALA